MQSFFKVALTTIGLVLILIGVVGVLVLTQAQDLLTKTVDEVLTKSFGSSATVKSVSLSPSNRALVLHGFALANPAGFEAADALRCRRIVVRVKPRTLLRDTPVIEMLDIEDVDINFHYEKGLGTNVAALARALAERADEDTPAFKLEKLRCRGARLHLDANFIPTESLATMIVNIRLENLSHGAPITAAEATSLFLRSVLAETLNIEGLLRPVSKNIRAEVDGLSTRDASPNPATDEAPPELFDL